MLGRLLAGLMLFVFSQSVFAIDPIAWSLNEPFPAKVFVAGAGYSVTYTFTNQLPLTLVKPITISKSSNPQDEFTFQDQCSGLKLTPKQSCTVTVTLDPTTSGVKTVQLTIAGYDKNRVPLPTLATSAVQESGQVSIASSVTTPLPSMMVVNTSSTFVFQFTNTGTESATGVTTSSSSSNFSSTCAAVLAPGVSCQISGSYTPTSTTPSVQTVTGTFSYAQGNPVIASTHTTVNPATGLTGVLSGLPAISIVGASYQVTYTYMNNNPTDMTITTNLPQPNVGVCPGAGCEYLAQANTCPVVTGVLSAGSSCYMTGLFTPTSTGNYSYSSTLAAAAASPGPTTSTLTTTTTTVAAGGARTVNFVNQCNFKVWFSMNGGAIGGSPNCTVDAQCPTGTSCDPSANGGNGLCFWINPTPSAHPSNTPVSPYELEALGGVNTNSVIVPVAANAIDVNTQWSGNISASALCNGTTKCDLADCNNKGGSASCTVGQGFSQPATQFEITMIKNDRDYYDVEVINGFHIPIQVTPISPYAIPGNDYNCGTPGNPTASGGFGSCNWNNAAPPAPTYAYNWVTNLAPCRSDNTCATAGQLCGLDSALDRVCGNFLGFWSADNACAVSPTKAQPYFGCNNYLGTPYQANTYQMSSLYGCVTPNAAQSTLNSCYIFNASDCCGCANWDAFGITIPAGTTTCKTTSNTIWTSQVQPTIQWMKSTCPNYYTYPYDDVSSTFRCSNVSSGSNAVGYTVTFCPGGNSGKPAGATEGRG
jgi:hypothetical protein